MKQPRAMQDIKIGKLLFYLAFLIFPLMTFCQANFKASVDYSSIPLNGKVTVTYTLSKGRVESFVRPDFSPFRVIGQQSFTGTGGMTIIINNQVIDGGDAESKWIFVLVPTQTGTFTIPPAKVKVDGKWYESNGLTINVIPQGKPQPATAQQSLGTKPSMPTTPPQETEEKDIFLRLVADKTSAYVGEQVIVRLLLYTRYDVSEYTLDKASMPSNVWSEELLDPRSPAKVWEENINGKKYLVAELKKTAIFPQVPGNLTIPSLEISAVIKIQDDRYDPFSMFDKFFKDPFNFNIDPFTAFGGVKLKKINLKSNVVNIGVLPLPEVGKPSNFQGAVGSFTAKATLESNQVRTGEMAALKITIQGKGNLPLIQFTPLEENDTFRLYNPDYQLNLNKTPTGIEGEKIITYLFQPEIAGKVQLKLQPFYFFDPVRKRYDSIVFPPLPLMVEQGGTEKVVNVDQKFKEDIRGIVEPVRVFSLNGMFGFSLKYWLIHALLLLVAVGLTLFYRRRLTLLANPLEYKTLQAQKMAKKRLKVAEKLMREQKVREFYDAIAQTLWLFITEKFKIPYVDLSREHARKVLEEHHIPAAVIDDFMLFLDEVDFYRFAPVSKNADMQEMYNKTSDFIVKLQLNNFKQ